MPPIRTLVLVEGESDAAAVDTLSRRSGMDISSHGIRISSAGGVGKFPRILEEFVRVHPTAHFCGMYDAAGDWATQVGIPAKSGVAGGLIGALPGQLGIATFSPRLDRHGNSVRGVSLFERFSADMGLHVMEVPPAARSVVRSNRVRGTGAGAARVLRLQGGIRFAGAERRGKNIGSVAAARRQIEHVYYALRDGHVRALDRHPARALARAPARAVARGAA